jgi:hypothetical protein
MAIIDMNYGNMKSAVAGLIANMELSNRVSATVEGAEVGFGKVVKIGSADGKTAAATAANDKVLGVTVYDHSVSAETPNGFAVDESALILEKGVIWVTAGATVAAGADVYMIVGGANAGKFTSVATDNLKVNSAKFASSGAADALVKIRL